MKIGRVGCSSLSKVVNHSRRSWYVCCHLGICVCGMYTDFARSWDPIFHFKRAAARYGWRVDGICIGPMLVYVLLSMAYIVSAEARFVF